MKAELNIENKSTFIALYTPYGEIWKTSNEGHQLKVATGNICLNLKPLSQISDEDAIEVGKLYGGFIDTPDDLQNYKDHVYLALIEDDEEAYAMWDHIGFQIMSQVIDFLRSRGYALPWMGLSVEELIEASWVKLIKS